MLKGSCDVVYANVLDSGTLSDFRKYSDTRQPSSRDLITSRARSLTTAGKRSKSNSSLRINRMARLSPQNQGGLGDEEEEEWREKLRFTFWDNEKKGELGQGDGTGYSCFVS